MATGSWAHPALGCTEEWGKAEEDRFPFEHEGQFWFIAKEGFISPLVRGPFADKTEAVTHWHAFWEWHDAMDAD